MPVLLDSEVAALLKVLNETFPKLGTEVTDAAEARARFEALRRPVDVPTPVEDVLDLAVGGADATTLPARLYRPLATAERPAGSVVFFHGGGWVLGDLDSHDELARLLCEHLGRTVVSVAYRLAPEHPYPIPVLDAVAAVRDLAARARELGLDEPFVLAGDSAGGNLAALAALELRGTDEPLVGAQLLLYPVLDAARATRSYADNAEGFYITAAHLAWFWDMYLGARGDGDDASPVRRRRLDGAPGTVVVTAGLDPLRDEGARYATLLAESGTDVVVLDYPQAFHGFLGFAGRLTVAAKALEDLGTAVDSVMVGGTAR